MKRSSLVLAMAIAPFLGLAGCEGERVDSTPLRPADNPGPWGRADEEALATRVKTALLAEPQLDGSAISVAVEGGRVTLSGEVPAPQIERAEAIVRGVEGVTEVINRLTATAGAS